MEVHPINKVHGFGIISSWLDRQEKSPFPFQEEAWKLIAEGKSGLVNAPTGCGKTYAVFLGALIRFINAHPDNWQTRRKNKIRLLWITPLRALAKDIGRAMEEVIKSLEMSWQVGIRNGDTPTAERQKQRNNLPEILIITPESLHILLSTKDH